MTVAFDAVTAAYGGRVIWHDVSFGVEAGQILGLIGPNGAGKTTLLRVAAGLIRPERGQIHRQGVPVYFGGEATMPGQCRADRWSALFGAAADARRVRRLSRGTRQMVGLRAWLAADNWQVGLLDEPWEGLDPAGARWLRDVMIAHRQRGAGIIVSSHRLHDVAEVCDGYAFLAHGELRVVAPSDIARGIVDASALMRMFDEIVRRP